MSIENKTLSQTDRKRLTDFMDKAVPVLQEIDDLKGGLRDTAKTIAEEFGWKASVLMKAARTAYKSSHDDEKETFNIIEEILEITQRS